MKVDAFELFLKQKRFDLIFKYLYIKKRHKAPAFYKELYCEHIRAFNGFFEIEPSDGLPKNTPECFIESYNSLHDSIKSKGYISEIGKIPIGKNGEISDGAHRLTVAALLGLKVEVEDDGRNDLYDYRFFKKQGLRTEIADYGAYEYVKLNPNAYIVNLHSIAPVEKDPDVEKILEKYGTVYYQKDIHLTFNGYVNLKKISYGSFWERESWIGNPQNKFAGAQMHARKSMNATTKTPLRAYVFVCDSIKKVLKAIEEIRELERLGNFSVHINDSWEEAICLAGIYFNDNSLHILNRRPFEIETRKLDDLIEQLKKEARAQSVNLDDICGAGSTPLNVAGVRESDDLDFLYAGETPFYIPDGDLSNHSSELRFYPYEAREIIHNPINHFYYNGLKFISLDVLFKMKMKRNEIPKDVNDIKLIKKIIRSKERAPFRFIRKVRTHDRKMIVICDFLKLTYKKIKHI